MADTASSTSVPTVQPWENPSSPYFLSSDNAGVSLVMQHLTEENYSTWSRAILISLDVKTKIGFIDGLIPKPQSPDHPCYAAWCKCNSTMLAWLFNTISKIYSLVWCILRQQGRSGLICNIGIHKVMDLESLS